MTENQYLEQEGYTVLLAEGQEALRQSLLEALAALWEQGRDDCTPPADMVY